METTRRGYILGLYIGVKSFNLWEKLMVEGMLLYAEVTPGPSKCQRVGSATSPHTETAGFHLQLLSTFSRA